MTSADGGIFDGSAARMRALGIAFTLAAALLWSLGGVGIKLVDASPLSIAGWRCAFALPVFLIAIGPRVVARTGAVALRSPYVWGAAVAYAATLVTFVVATRLTTAANAIVLQYTGPVYVALLSGPVLGERIARKDVLALVGVVIGMVVFSLQELSADGRLGMAVGLLSGVSFAALPLFLRLELRHGERTPGSSVMAILLGNALGAAVCLPAMVGSPPADGASWAIVAGLGLFQIGVAYLCYGAGVRRLRAMETSLVTTVEPVLNPLWVALGTGERPGPFAIVGGLVIVASVALQGALPARPAPQPR